MESRILKVSAARTSAHFVGNRRGGGFAPALETSIRALQYTIPAVGHHYGNAFAPDDDDDDEEEEDSRTYAMSAQDQYGQPLNVASTTDGEYYDDDEEEEVDEDVEMSPAIEVISIDPNCDYDSEEEDDNEETEDEEEVQAIHQLVAVPREVKIDRMVIPEPVEPPKADVEEHAIEASVVRSETAVEHFCDKEDVDRDVIEGLENDDIEPELQNLHRDSEEEGEPDNRDGSSSSSSSSSDSDSSKNSSRSSSSSSSSSSRSTSSASSHPSDHPSDYVHRSDQEEADTDHKDNLARVYERRKLMAIDRRKRTSSTNRKSFSLPQSPVAAGVGNLMHEMTSLSFEDLDVSAIVNDLSPLKIPVRASESDEKLVEELAESNFDLAAYITEDDFVATDSATSTGRSDENRPKKEQPKQMKSSPVKRYPKSGGKQLKMLRELMNSPKSDANDASGGTRRSCTNKTRRIVENSGTETEESESEVDSRACVKIFGIERTIGKSKRKDDDMKADPTWNPFGAPSAKLVQRPVQGQKTVTTPPAIVQPLTPIKSEPSETKSQSSPVKVSESSSKPSNSTNSKHKVLSAGSQLARNKMLSLMAKSKLSTHTVKHSKPASSSSSSSHPKPAEKAPEPPKKKPPTSTNIKLDHDYCSPKKGVSQSTLAPVPQRKAIEIPFLLPTMDQLRQKKKFSKNKKRLEVTDKKVKTGDNCDKKSQKVEVVNSGTRIGGDSKIMVVVPVEKEVLVKEEPVDIKVEPIAASIALLVQPQPQPQQKQVSLLKINMNKPNGVQTAPDCTVKLEAPDEKPKSELQLINATNSSSNECVIKVKKKLNLQEYKKRRELPADDSGLLVPATESSSKSSISSSSSTISESSSKEEIISLLPLEQNAQPHEEQPSPNGDGSQKQTRNKIPLDPISAAKLKALRMQQLKKEAAIKSTEAKTIPKTVPEIVPLAEITSIKFDEHGNPFPYDKNAEKDASGMKLHADYEELIIVSMGCNTHITINPREANRETVKTKDSSTELQEKNIPKNELLTNVTDTIKRCQSSAPTLISSSSLISSIHEVVSKKKSCNKTDTVTAAPADKRSVDGGQANQQGSPNIGISPPNAFSPGKPEKAGGAYEQSPSFDYDEGQLQRTSEEAKPDEHGEDKIIMHLRKDRQRTKGVSIGIQTMSFDRFPELKKLSPIKKERTASRSSCGSAQRARSRQSAERSRDRSRRQYRKRRSRSSSSEPETRNRSSNSYRSCSKRSSSRRSRSRCSSRRRSHTRSRSYRRRSRSDSRRRRSSVSSERRRYYERDYSRRGRSSKRRRSRSNSSHYSSSSYSSQSRSRSRSTRTRSRSSSRPSSRVVNQARTDFRRQTTSPERKIVYVGRLEAALKREDLKRKFVQYGRIKQVTLHYKESGAKYGFVTFEKPQDAYKAIDQSSNDPNLREYDVSFGGRRAFCRTEYADLDGDLSHDLEPITYIAPDGSLLQPPVPIVSLARKDEGESFEDMLKKLKKEISAKKPRKS